MAKRKRNIKKTITMNDILKATRHGEWMATNENECGFVSKHKVHKSKKNYTRKSKHKNDYQR